VQVGRDYLPGNSALENLEQWAIESGETEMLRQDGHHAIGLRKRQRPNPERIDDGEHQEVDPDRHGQHKGRHRDIAWMVSEEAGHW
jgi:hypothetical protein